MLKQYTISEVSQITGIRPSTLRYYEKEGLLKNIARKNNTHRFYTDHDIELLNLIKCFKELGMSIKSIKQFINEKSEHLSSMDDILEQHLEFLYHQRTLINQNIEKIESKLKLK